MGRKGRRGRGRRGEVGEKRRRGGGAAERGAKEWGGEEREGEGILL